LSREKPPALPKRAKEILSYFMRNPSAADSLEGVARWRLLEEKIHQGTEETRRALKWLVSHGFLVEERRKGAQPIFSLNGRNTEKTKELLQQDKMAAPRMGGNPAPRRRRAN
jgi:hypothetical protein